MKCNILIRQIEPSCHSFQLFDRWKRIFYFIVLLLKRVEANKRNFQFDMTCVDRVPSILIKYEVRTLLNILNTKFVLELFCYTNFLFWRAKVFAEVVGFINKGCRINLSEIFPNTNVSHRFTIKTRQTRYKK